MSELKTNARNAKRAILFIYIVLGFRSIFLFINAIKIQMLLDYHNGATMDVDLEKQLEFPLRIYVIVYLVLFIVSVVFFLKWFRSAYANLQLFVKGLSSTPGWTIGSWFVPILSLYKPHQIMKELHFETSKLLTRQRLIEKKEISYVLINSWWGLWITLLFGRVIVGVATRNTSQVGLLMMQQIWGITDVLLFVALSFCLVKIIRNHQKMEEQMSLLELGSEAKPLKMGEDDLLDSGF